MNHSWPFLALLFLVTKTIVWSSVGARLVSKDWAKTCLAEGEIFWGNQQACKGERGQWKKVEKYQTCKAKAFWGNTALHSVGPLDSFCCHHLPAYSHHKHTDIRHQLLQLSSISVLIMVLLRASTELWFFPLLKGRPGFTGWRLQWHAVCQLYLPGCLQRWAFAIFGGSCNWE